MDRARGPMNRQIFPKQKPDPETIKRLLSYVSKDYKTPFIFIENTKKNIRLLCQR